MLRLSSRSGRDRVVIVRKKRVVASRLRQVSDDKMASPSPGAKVASARKQRGWTQSDLARAARISRQAVFQIESGITLPRIDTALRIANALGGEVHALFSEEASDAIRVAAGGPGAGARVHVIHLEGRWVAHSSDAPDRMGAGFHSSDGVLVREGGGLRLDTCLPRESLEENLFLAGCDPALGIFAEEVTQLSRQRGRCVWIPCGNGEALRRLIEGETQVAGIHFDGKSDEANLAAIKKSGLEKSCTMLRFSRWEQGWMLGPSAGKSFHGIGSLSGSRLRLANRERGSGCRTALDRMAREEGVPTRKIRGYQSVTTNHAGCARWIASGFADVGLGCAAMARLFALGFVPLEQTTFDLVIRRDHLDKPLVRALCNLLQSGKFLRMLAGIPGYETSSSGQVILP